MKPYIIWFIKAPLTLSTACLVVVIVRVYSIIILINYVTMNRTEQKISDGVKVYSIAHFSPTEELPVLRSECQAYPAVCPKV